MLLGLSEVDEWAHAHQATITSSGEASKSGSEGVSGEASLATRMACLAILAMVTESETVVQALLTLDRLFPVLLSNLVLDRSDDEERNGWERADLKPTNAAANRKKADIDAEVQLNAVNLSLRASYVLFTCCSIFRQTLGSCPRIESGASKGSPAFHSTGYSQPSRCAAKEGRRSNACTRSS